MARKNPRRVLAGKIGGYMAAANQARGVGQNEGLSDEYLYLASQARVELEALGKKRKRRRT